MEPTWNLELTVLGGLGARFDGRALDLGGPKQRLVLALLLLAEGRPLTVDQLVDGVWGDDVPDRVEQSLQSYVSNLRKALEPHRAPRQPATVLLTAPTGYSVEVDRGQLDLTRYADLAAGDSLDDLRAAVEMYAPLLPEFLDVPAVLDHARRLDALHADTRERWLSARLAAGEDSSLVADLRAAVAEVPLDERLWGHLALALYRSGRQTDALRALDEARRTLADEVGVEPGPALRQLEADILAQSPTLDLAAERTPTGSGLQPTADPRSTAAQNGRRSEGATPRRPFVGRERETAALAQALGRAIAGDGTAVVISGEPGIGKTSLAEHLVDAARAEGVTVAWARCPESAATGPFHAVGEVAAQLEAAGVIDLGDRLGFEVVTDETDRIGIYQRTVETLRRGTGPAVMVIDDLHWADPGTLRLLEYVAGEFRHLPMLLVVTTRPPTAESPEPLLDCLAELARAHGSIRLDVVGLDVDDVADWIEQRADHGVDGRLAALVHDRSGGNPFFAQELVELLVGEDRLDAAALDAGRVPAAVADVVRRRVGRLPAPTQQLLSVASVVGRAFDLDVVARVAGEPFADALGALDAAVDSGLVAADPGTSATYRFSHALVAEALETELSPSRRARLHAAAATALAELRATRLDDHLAELAHHALAGAVAGTAADAVEWCRRAAARAEAAHAPEDAAGHYERALGVLDLAHPGDLRRRLDLLRALAAAWSAAGSEERSQAVAAEAIAVADQLGDVDAMVDAALGMVHHTLWQPGGYGESDARLLAAVDRVLERLGPDGDVAARVVLDGFRTNLTYYVSPPAELDERSAAAVELARTTGDDALVARSLAQRLQSIWFAHNGPERLADATELADLGSRPGVDPRLSAHGALIRIVAAYQLGSYDPADLERLTAAVATFGTPIQRLELEAFAASRLAAEGRYAESLARAEAADELFRTTKRRNRDAVMFGARVLALGDLGMADDLMARAGPMAGGEFSATLAEMVAFVMTEFGMADRARATIGPVGSTPTLRYDWLWLSAMNNAAIVRGMLGDVEACSQLLDVLAPYTGQVATAGSMPVGGCLDTALARMAAVVGDHDAALRHAAVAIDVETRMGARAWLARALEVKAELTGDIADRRAALDLATEIGCQPVMRRLGAA